MNLLIAFLLAIGTYTAWTVLSIYRNWRICRGTNLPIVISPTATLNPFWIITYKLFPPILPILRRLPFSLGAWSRYTYMGWQFDDCHNAHDTYGPAFIVCTPSINEVHVADPGAVQAIFAARKAFIKPAVMYDGLNVFGKNVDSVEGETWQRHRRITAPSLNERISESVWVEGVHQAREMLKHWVGKGVKGTNEIMEDTAELTLNVFLHAGFGLQSPFREEQERVEGPHMMSYRDALGLVLKNFTLLVILPMSALKWPIWPQSMRKVGLACDEYKLYLEEMVERQSLDASSTPKEQGNLLAALVQANRVETGINTLADDELYGNLFVYNLAGHETTANTMTSAIAYLAANPRFQDWLSEEIRDVTKDTDPQTWGYAQIFPRLTRCQAVMYETLRRHGSIVFVPKAAAPPSQTIMVSGTPHVIPADTFVNVNVQALHSDKKVWGADALVWRPDRWIDRAKLGGLGHEELIEPVPGAFVPWAEGPRACPGKKFSQVDFVAALAVLFRNHVVRPRREDAEDEQSAAKRVYKMIANSTITAITLQMKSPKDVSFVWSER